MSIKTKAIKAVQAFIDEAVKNLPAGQEAQIKQLLDKAESLPESWYEAGGQLNSLNRCELIDKDTVRELHKIGEDIARQILTA